MKNKRLGAVGVVMCLVGATAMASNSDTRIVDSVSGASEKLIQVALPKFLAKGLSLDGYRIIVLAIGENVVVLFEDINTPAGQLGSSSARPSFEVELTKDGAKVMRANFVR